MGESQRLPGTRRFVAMIGAVAALLAPVSAHGLDLLVEGERVKLRTKPIETFHIGHSDTKFGRLTFLGGLELLASDRKVGGLSGMIMLDQGDAFLAVTDNGHWVAGDVQQTDEGAPTGIDNLRIASLLGADGKTLRARWGHDTEALTLSPSGLYVTAETRNAIYHYPWPLTSTKTLMVGEVALPEEASKLPRNAGLEALAAAPDDGALAGKLVAVAESTPSDAHDFPAFLIGPNGSERFSIRRRDRFDATDAAFLPNGDLVLLERRFNLRDLIGMRLRRFDAASIKPGAVVDGEVILEADFSHQIDNMEALAIHQNAAGEVILTLLSDNNRSLLQRTVFLRFRLDEDES
ncbi:esterase-like activity of phytase family protein [Roseibium sp. MMSF_3544]|uniref:esterase-like activity of phytase family protein n=1 Tax=unclassified Roseibium TaxID=2629323 RepID=UPI00273D9634|nr:esterase-like activity of phytase family protein [Roseibium sp. MMSF_3544]